MRPSVLAFLLAALVFPVTLPAQTSTQSGPPIGLSGFVLGSPGTAVRASGRCTPRPTEANYDVCVANDSTIVSLSRDTIVRVDLVARVPRRHQGSTDWWEHGLRQYAERLFGPADTVVSYSAGTGGSVPVVPSGSEWDLVKNGHGLMANWFRHGDARWEAQVVLGQVYFSGRTSSGLQTVDVLTRAEMVLACAGRLLRRVTPDSAGVLVPIALPGPTASCPRAP